MLQSCLSMFCVLLFIPTFCHEPLTITKCVLSYVLRIPNLSVIIPFLKHTCLEPGNKPKYDNFHMLDRWIYIVGPIP